MVAEIDRRKEESGRCSSKTRTQRNAPRFIGAFSMDGNAALQLRKRGPII
jgi:hypothetical protein